MSAIFAAKWAGTCHVCGFNWEKGEYIHYVEGRVAHEHCGATDEPDHKVPYRTPAYAVRGKREPKLCGTCFLEHNGECP